MTQILLFIKKKFVSVVSFKNNSNSRWFQSQQRIKENHYTPNTLAEISFNFEKEKIFSADFYTFSSAMTSIGGLMGLFLPIYKLYNAFARDNIFVKSLGDHLVELRPQTYENLDNNRKEEIIRYRFSFTIYFNFYFFYFFHRI